MVQSGPRALDLCQVSSLRMEECEHRGVNTVGVGEDRQQGAHEMGTEVTGLLQTSMMRNAHSDQSSREACVGQTPRGWWRTGVSSSGSHLRGLHCAGEPVCTQSESGSVCLTVLESFQKPTYNPNPNPSHLPSHERLTH